MYLELILALQFIIERTIDQNRSIGGQDAELRRCRAQRIDDLPVHALVRIVGVHLTQHSGYAIVLENVKGVIPIEERLLIVDVGDVQLKDHRASQTRLTEISSAQFDLIGRRRLAIEPAQRFNRVIVRPKDLQVEESIRFDVQLRLERRREGRTLYITTAAVVVVVARTASIVFLVISRRNPLEGPMAILLLHQRLK